MGSCDGGVSEGVVGWVLVERVCVTGEDAVGGCGGGWAEGVNSFDGESGASFRNGNVHCGRVGSVRDHQWTICRG